MKFAFIANLAKALFCLFVCLKGASEVALVVKNPPANAGDAGETGSIPGLGIFLGGGNDNPLQYPRL